MKTVLCKKGYSPKLAGSPLLEVETLSAPSFVAALPERIPYIKPKLMVAEGDSVKVGSLLYVDKRNPNLKFRSPGGGIVRGIHYGPRRVLREIVVELAEVEDTESLPSLSEQDLERIDRSELIARILDGGLWPLFRELPYRDIARPDRIPPTLIVSLCNSEPFHPDPQIYLAPELDRFRFGLKALAKVAGSGMVQVAVRPDALQRVPDLADMITHGIVGPYPADDPGVLLYRTKTSAEANRSWFIHGQDLLLVAELLQSGRYPTQRTVAVAGSQASDCRHYRTRMGAPLSHLVRRPAPNGDTRYIVGGMFTGWEASPETFLGFYETSLLLLPEGNVREFLALFSPGYRKPSYSRLFLSCLNPSELVYDCNRHGGERACIACMHCAEVCPVDILPQMTYKAILAEEVEEYLEHGLLDCVECGLCSFVCPAKIELAETLKAAKQGYAKEQLG